MSGESYGNIKQEFSDVVFIVDGRRFECNKALVASRSAYFKTLLFGEFKEKNESEIELQNVDPDAFQAILQYLYSEQVNLSTLEFNIVLEVLRSCHEWQISEFLKSVSKYIETNINLNNFCSILNHAVFLELEEMVTKCGTFCDENAQEILESSIFKELSTESFCELLKRDSVYEHKEDLFNTVTQWVKDVSAEESKLVLSELRLQLFDHIFLLTTVKDSGLISIDKVCEAVLLSLQDKHLVTCKVILDENIATLKKGAKILNGQFDWALHGDPTEVELYTTHRKYECIVIVLNEIYILDFIQFRLYNDAIGDFEYKYKLEVSVDAKKWDMIVDNSDTYCSDWQKFTFKERPIKFIKMTGVMEAWNNRKYRDPNKMVIHFIEASLKRNSV